MGCAVNTPRPLCRQEKRPDIHSTGDWVGLGAGRNGYGKSLPTWVPPSRPLRVAIPQLIHKFSSRKCYIEKSLQNPTNGCNPEGATKCYTSSHFHDFVITSVIHIHF